MVRRIGGEVMKTERLCLLIGFLLLVPLVSAGGVTLRSGDELYATNLTFKINNTIMFESPVQISNDGYVIFGTQNFSVYPLTAGEVNVTILNHTNTSASNGTNFWFLLQGQNTDVTVYINNIPGASRYVVETGSDGVQTSEIANDYASSFAFPLNASTTGKYIRVGFSTPAAAASTGGGGGDGGSISGSPATTTTIPVVTTTQRTVTTVPTTTITQRVTTTTEKIIEEPIRPSIGSKMITIVLLILVTVAVIVWLFQSLKNR